MKKRLIAALTVLMMLTALLPGAAQADILEDDLPTVDAQSYIVADGDTGTVLFGSDYNKEVDPGSLVQIMTAVLIIEEGNLNDTVTVGTLPDEANEGNRLYLREGEKVTMSDLLEGIIVYNANDAAVAAATHIGGNTDTFIDMMNRRAQDLGMTHTTFKSVFGKADGQTTTAQDMAILAAHASSLPKYVELAIQPNMDWDGEMNQDTYVNVNGMQDVDPQAVGIKFNTDDVDLAATLTKSDRTVVGVMLGGQTETTSYDQMQAVLDLAMENTAAQKVVSKGDVVTTLNFSGNRSIPLAADDSFSITAATGDLSGITTKIVLNKVELPISQGDAVGVMNIYNGNEQVGEVKLIAQASASEGVNVLLIVTCILSLLYIATLIYNFITRHHRKPARPKAPRKGGAAPVSRPRMRSNAQEGAAKSTAPQAAPRKNAPRRPQNPSAGSAEGRRGLEERLERSKQENSRRSRR